MRKAISLIIIITVLLCACSGGKAPTGPISLKDPAAAADKAAGGSGGEGANAGTEPGQGGSDGQASGVDTADITKPDINLIPKLPSAKYGETGQGAQGGQSGGDGQAAQPEPERIAEALGAEAAAYTELALLYGVFARESAGNAENAIDNLISALRGMKILNSERKEYEITSSLAETRAEDLGFASRDINGDGVPELFILSRDFTIYSIYTLIGGAPVLIGAYWSRNACSVDASGTLYICADNGASDNYNAKYTLAPAKADLSLAEMFGVESRDGVTGAYLPEPRFYKSRGDGDETINDTISEEEAGALYAGFPDVHSGEPTKDAGLKYVPFLK